MMKFYRGFRNTLAASIALWLLVAVGSRVVHAQLNCSGGLLNCPGTPTGTGVAVLQTSPTLTSPAVTGVETITGSGSATYPLVVTYSGGTRTGKIYIDVNGPGFFTEVGAAFGIYLDENQNRVSIRANSTFEDALINQDGSLTMRTGITAGTAVTAGATSTTTITTANFQFRGNSILKDGFPTCSGGGCAIIAASINSVGKLTTTTTGAADITVTFSANFNNAPSCFADNQTTGNLLRATTELVGSFHLQGVTVSGDTLGWFCAGN